VVKEKGATALIDGHGAFGQLAMRLATDIAVRKAREFGVAMVAVRDSFWLAGLAVYMIPIAEAGFLAQLWVQHSSGKDCAPFGGIEPRFSTNPVAFTFPTPGAPMVSDFSTAVIAMGKVGGMVRRGEKADEPLFIDADGNLTDDPVAMKRGGSMLFTGGERHGYKGYAMSLWSEALTAMAGGRTNDPAAPSRQAFNLTVVDPEAFAGPDAYLAELNGFLARMRACRLRPGFTEIRLPGERGLRALADARRLGVPVDDENLDRLNEIAANNRVPGLSRSS
jgi:L-lactate dehydrogenase